MPRGHGPAAPLAHPNLVCDVAIGQSTGPSQRVRGNLFYRGLVLARPVFVGETLRTRTEVVGLKQNRRRPGASRDRACRAADPDRPTQHGEPVLDFWRCPMIPLRDAGRARPATPTTSPTSRRRSTRRRCAPRCRPAGGSTACARRAPGPHRAELEPGQAFVVEAGETVTGAPELARLTLNVATAHTDATGSAHGRRLVYGGHTISIAAAHAARAIPAIATIVAWQGCEHLGPVFEGDVLRTELRVEARGPRRARRPARAGQRRARRRRARAGARLELRGGGAAWMR